MGATVERGRKRTPENIGVKMRVVIRKRKGGKHGERLMLDVHHQGRRKRITLPTTNMAEAKRMAEQVER